MKNATCAFVGQNVQEHIFLLNSTGKTLITMRYDRRGGVEVERSPRMREIGLRPPVATDLSRKNS